MIDSRHNVGLKINAHGDSYFMNVNLTAELENFVVEKVKSGLYNSASEVVREGLRLLKEQDELRKLKLKELRREIRKGLDSLDRGEFTTFNSAAEIADRVKAEGRKRLAAKTSRKRK
jgi:antitoxin ParD1/3/4